MFLGFVQKATRREGKSAEQLSGAIGQLQTLFKKDEALLSNLGQEGANFNAGMSELANKVSWHAKQGSAGWINLARSWALLFPVLMKESHARNVELVWEPAALQACVMSLLHVVDVLPVEGLKACAVLMRDNRGTLLGKEGQEAVVQKVLPKASVILVSSPQATDQAPKEDDKEEHEEEEEEQEKQPLQSLKQSSWATECLSHLVGGGGSVGGNANLRRKVKLSSPQTSALCRVGLENVAALWKSRVSLPALAASLVLLEGLCSNCTADFVAHLGGARMGNLVELASCIALPWQSSDLAKDDVAAGGDSGFSSFGEGLGPGRAVEKVRVRALLLLSSLASHCFQHCSTHLVSCLLPYSMRASSDAQALYGVLLYDPSPKVRLHAILFLLAFLKPSKTLFAAASAAASSTFISLSYKLALTLRDLHTTMTIALSAEDDATNQTHLLRAIPSLVAVTPYAKLAVAQEKDYWLLFPILKGLEGKMCVDLPCLSAVLNVLRVKGDLPDVRYWIEQGKIVEQLSDVALLKQGGSLRTTAESCLGELSRRYPEIMSKFMLQDSLLERLLSGAPPATAEGIDCVLEFANVLPESVQVDCWKRIIMLLLSQQKMFFLSGDAVMASFVTLLSAIPAVAWIAQPEKIQLAIIAAVAGVATSDCASPVKLAAVKSVGSLLMIDELVADNFRFLQDAKALVVGASDAAEYWTMGNLAHAISTAHARCTTVEDRSDLAALMETLIPPALVPFGDSKKQAYSAPVLEKVRCSCLRVIGKSALVLPGPVMSKFLSSYWKILRVCLKADQRPKLRWNACVALGQLLEGSAGKLCDADVRLWPVELKAMLDEILNKSANYKERINAASVLEKNCNRKWLMGPGQDKLIETLLAREQESIKPPQFEQEALKYEAILQRILQNSRI